MVAQKKQVPSKYTYIVFSVVLFLIILIFGSLAFVLSMWKIQYTNAGKALSRAVELEMLRLEASTNGEISLVLKMADSSLVRQYFLNPDDPELEKLAFEEFAGYRRAFASKSVFWINDIDKKFYFNDNDSSYPLDPNEPVNYWYNMTLKGTEEFNFNINYNPDLNVTDLWINAPVFDKDRRPIGMVGTGIDVSAFIDTVYHNYSEDGVLFFFDEAGEITGAMDKGLVANKASLENELGKTGTVIFSMMKGLEDENIQYFRVPGGVAALCAIPGYDWYVCSFLPLGLKDTLGTSMTVLFAVLMAVVAGIFIIFNLIHINHELKRERNLYKNMSIADVLTGIYNRRFLEENVERLIKSLSRSGDKLSLLMLDVDFFKKYNDTYGHGMGDICLKTVANTISQSISRANDFVARYGGEEFAVVLPNADERGAYKVAQRMLQNIRERNIPHEKNDVAAFVTVSIGGVTSIVVHSHTGNDYLKKADEALYKSKQNGRNRYTVYGDDPD